MGIWYKEFYLATPNGEALIREALTHPTDGLANRADVEKRLSEMEQIDENRCHITRDQRRFLRRMLDAQ